MVEGQFDQRNQFCDSVPVAGLFNRDHRVGSDALGEKYVVLLLHVRILMFLGLLQDAFNINLVLGLREETNGQILGLHI